MVDFTNVLRETFTRADPKHVDEFDPGENGSYACLATPKKSTFMK